MVNNRGRQQANPPRGLEWLFQHLVDHLLPERFIDRHPSVCARDEIIASQAEPKRHGQRTTTVHNLADFFLFLSDPAKSGDAAASIRSAIAQKQLQPIGTNKFIYEPDMQLIDRTNTILQRLGWSYLFYTGLSPEASSAYLQMNQEFNEHGYPVLNIEGVEDIIIAEKTHGLFGDDFVIRHPGTLMPFARHCIDLAAFMVQHPHIHTQYDARSKLSEVIRRSGVAISTEGREMIDAWGALYDQNATAPFVDRCIGNHVRVRGYESETGSVLLTWDYDKRSTIAPMDFETIEQRATHEHNIEDIICKTPYAFSAAEEQELSELYDAQVGTPALAAEIRHALRTHRAIRLSFHPYGNRYEHIPPRAAAMLAAMLDTEVPPTARGIAETLMKPKSAKYLQRMFTEYSAL